LDRSSRDAPASPEDDAAVAPHLKAMEKTRRKPSTERKLAGKYETRVTRANGGNHDPQQTRRAWSWIDTCSMVYKSARLYHLSFVMADQEFRFMNVAHIHKGLLKRLMQHLRRNGIEASFYAARELDDDKGEHLHIFLCVEAAFKRPNAILNRKPDRWLAKAAAKAGVRVYINPPRNQMHRGLDYATLPKTKPAKIADAKCWVSYLFKRRSKPAEGQVYSCSRMPLIDSHNTEATNEQNNLRVAASSHYAPFITVLAADLAFPVFSLSATGISSDLDPTVIDLGAECLPGNLYRGIPTHAHHFADLM